MSSERYLSSMRIPEDEPEDSFYQNRFANIVQNARLDLLGDRIMTDGSDKTAKEFISDRMAAGTHILRVMEMCSIEDGTVEKNPRAYVDQLEVELRGYKDQHTLGGRTQQDLEMALKNATLEDAINRLNTVINFSEALGGWLPPGVSSVVEAVFERLSSEITVAGHNNEFETEVSLSTVSGESALQGSN